MVVKEDPELNFFPGYTESTPACKAFPPEDLRVYWAAAAHGRTTQKQVGKPEKVYPQSSGHRNLQYGGILREAEPRFTHAGVECKKTQKFK